MDNDSLGAYLKDCGRIRLLTADEEITLGHLVQKMIHIQETVPEAERTRAHKRAIKRGERAKRKMVECNLRLVVAVAKKYQHIANKITLEDLIQEGNLGLIRAVEKFDPSRGYKFSTYSFWWIRQAVSRALSYQNRIIRLPGSALPTLFKARDYISEYRREHGKNPTIEQIAKHVQATPESIKLYLAFQQDAGSLDRPALTSESDKHLIDIIADPNSLETEYMFDDQDAATILDMVDALDERHKDVIIKRYGLDGKEPRTLVEIGKEVGTSREAVRNMELRAMKRLMVIANQNHLGKIYA